MNQVGGIVLSLALSFVWTFLLFNLYAYLAFRIAKIQKHLGDPQVLLTLIAAVILSIVTDLLPFHFFPKGIVFDTLSTFMYLCIVGILCFGVAKYYWRLEQKSAMKFSALIVLFNIILLIFSLVVSYFGTQRLNDFMKASNQLDNQVR